MKTLLVIIILLATTLKQFVPILPYEKKTVISDAKNSSASDEISIARKELEEFEMDIVVFVDYTIDHIKASLGDFFLV